MMTQHLLDSLFAVLDRLNIKDPTARIILSAWVTTMWEVAKQRAVEVGQDTYQQGLVEGERRLRARLLHK